MQKIVQQSDEEMEVLEKVELLKEKAEKRIEEILEDVLGIKNKIRRKFYEN